MVPSFKYLGMTLDSTLTFNAHVKAVLRNVSYKISLLAKMKTYLNNDIAIQIYKSMILPYLDYADVIFSRTNTANVDKLQRLQNRGLKVCQGYDVRYDTTALHKEAKIPFLRDRRNAHALNFMFKRKADRNLLNLREIRTRAHDAPLFNVLTPRCEAAKRSVVYYGSSLWNDLTPQLRNTQDYFAFKAIQKKNMLIPVTLNIV